LHTLNFLICTNCILISIVAATLKLIAHTIVKYASLHWSSQSKCTVSYFESLIYK
jgi:hypothetical protein